jgi:flavin-dependent dehydrogenase
MEIADNNKGSVDLAIVGGGPAGTAAALEARRHGMRVAVWERDSFPRDKVCGEFLSAEALPLLTEEIPAVLTCASTIRRSEFIAPSGQVYSFDLPNPGRGLSRRLMDEALWQAVNKAGALTHEGEVVKRLHKFQPSRNHGEGWEIESSSGTTTRTNAMLVACGRWWMIEGLPSPARQRNNGSAGHWMGAKAHFQDVAYSDAVEMYFFPGGYCGLAPIENGMYNVCCLVHRDLAREGTAGGLGNFFLWLRNVAHHPALEARLRGTIQVSETVSTAPLRPARLRGECEGTLLAGDAAGFLDPFTGDGISMALHSGRLAASEIAKAWSCVGVDTSKVAESYQRRLGRSVRRSYVVAGLLRALVSAPASLQSSMAKALPKLGQRLLQETRWRVTD